MLFEFWTALAITGVWSRTVSSFSTQQQSRPNNACLGRMATSLPADTSGVYVPLDHAALSQLDFREEDFKSPSRVYVSNIVRDMNEEELDAFLLGLSTPVDGGAVASALSGTFDDTHPTPRRRFNDTYVDEPGRQLRLLRRRVPDPLWEQIKLEARHALSIEPEAGPQLYQAILSQPSLMDALANIISHEIETELMPATALRGLILDMLTAADDLAVHIDAIAAVNRSPSASSTALLAVMFNNGLHALVTYRVGHRLWQADRKGMAYYIQSTVSAKYSADIHPAAKIGSGTYLNVGGGVVIGETVRVGNDCTILQGVTLGGTGKDAGDRHPKVGDGVILSSGATVLGNIPVGDGAVVTAKSIVTKPVPPYARVSGVPAKVRSYRELGEDGVTNGRVEEPEVDRRLREKYEEHWGNLKVLTDFEKCIDARNPDWEKANTILNY